jgi:hypothetical protein
LLEPAAAELALCEDIVWDEELERRGEGEGEIYQSRNRLQPFNVLINSYCDIATIDLFVVIV